MLPPVILTGAPVGYVCGGSFLKEAAAAATPARFVDRCKVHEVTHSQGVTTGVRATVVGAGGRTFELRVLCPTVICAGGAINSPALLLRSKVPDASGMIGRNALPPPVAPTTALHMARAAAAQLQYPPRLRSRTLAVGTCGYILFAPQWA